MNSFLCDKNEIYLYFESIRQLKPKAVLDIGMVLYRCGALCRQAANGVIDPNVFLCGVTDKTEDIPNVYQVIYNEILTPEGLLMNQSKAKRFDLSFCFFPEQLNASGKKLLPFLKQTVSRIIIKKGMEKELLSCLSPKISKTITYEGHQLLMLSMTGE